MKKNLIKGLVVSALAFSVPVFSDTTEDLVNALVTKGILTEDEAALLSKQHASESKATLSIPWTMRRPLRILRLFRQNQKR